MMVHKVEKKDYPVLFIGLGGTGKDTVIAIKKKFQERLICDPATNYPRRAAFLVLDADDSQCGPGKPITSSEWISLAVPQLKDLLDPKNRADLPEYEQAWLNPNLTPEAIALGAGGVRQIGRFQLFRHVADFHDKFTNALNKNVGINNEDPGITLKIDVVICGGLCGGTCSGTFLDVAYLTRQWLKDNFPNYDVNTYGFFMLPEVYLKDSNFSFNDKGKVQLTKANAYASLKELDFWMNTEGSMTFEQAYANGIKATWGGKPLSLTFLMDNKRESGNQINNPYRTCINKVAEMMLHVYADEQGAVFTFSSFMSNVSTSLLDISKGEEHNIPINYSFAALGVSTTEAVEQMVNAYETKLVLGKVEAVPLYIPLGAPEGTEPTAYYAIPSNEFDLYKKLFGDTFQDDGLGTLDDALDAMVSSELENFNQDNQYKGMELSKEEIREADKALFVDKINSYVGNDRENGWSYDAVTKTEELFVNEKHRFESLMKSDIQDIYIGPGGVLDIIENSLIPKLKNLSSLWKVKGDAGKAEYKNNQDSAENLSRTIRGYSMFEKAGYALHPNTQLEAYGTYERRAATGRREAIYAEKRKKGIDDLLDYVQKYQKKLTLMVQALREIREGCEQQLSSASNEKGALVTTELLENYFETNQANNFQQNKITQIANAQQSILQRLADESFNEVGFTEGRTLPEIVRDMKAMRNMVNQFLDNVTATLHMNNLNWMVEAHAPHDSAEQDKYMLQKLCVNLDQSAEAMLPASKTDNIPVLSAEKRYLSVPKDSDTLIRGFEQYQNNGGAAGTEIKQSEITDRVLWLKVKVGVAAANILPDIEDLHKEYEKRLQGDARLSAGIHLVESIPARKLKEPWHNTASWGLLPNLLAYELHPSPDKMTPRESDNWATAQSIFLEADRGGLIEYQDGGDFVISFMRDDMHPEEFQKDVNSIAENIALSPETRKEELLKKQKEWMNQSAPIHFGRYLNRMLTTQQVKKPQSVEGPTAMENYEKRRKEVRAILCAYLVTHYPRYLRQLQNQLENTKYFNGKMECLDVEIAENQKKKEMYRSYARMLTCGRIINERNSFCLVLDGIKKRLFDGSVVKLGLNDYPENVQDEAMKYTEAVFLMQLYQEMPTMNIGTKNTLEGERKKYDGSPFDFSQRFPDMYLDYVKHYKEAKEKYVSYLGDPVTGRMSEIDVSEIFGQYGIKDTTALRNALKEVYKEMLAVLNEDYQGLKADLKALKDGQDKV